MFYYTFLCRSFCRPWSLQSHFKLTNQTVSSDFLLITYRLTVIAKEWLRFTIIFHITAACFCRTEDGLSTRGDSRIRTSGMLSTRWGQSPPLTVHTPLVQTKTTSILLNQHSDILRKEIHILGKDWKINLKKQQAKTQKQIYELLPLSPHMVRHDFSL